ncbi:MAG: phage protein Gp36 family protein [Pseudomonadota bacterium]
MAFLTLLDYRSKISEHDLEALRALDAPVPVFGTEPEEADEPDQSIREQAEEEAMTEVASYLRGRFDMTAAYAATGQARNKHLVMIVVDVAIWNLSPQVAFAVVPEIRESRYKAAIAWLKLAESGKSNPELPRYEIDPEKPQARRLFRYGSNAPRVQSF